MEELEFGGDAVKAISIVVYRKWTVLGAVLGLVLNKKEKNIDVEIWVDQWPDAKAVLAKEDAPNPAYSFRYNVFMLDELSLEIILRTPGVVDLQKPTIFSCVTRNCFTLLSSALENHRCEITNDYYLYYVDKDSLKIVDIPPNMTSGKLSADHAQLVLQCWEKISSFTLPFYETAIEIYPSVGLFDDAGNLIAFELCKSDGSVAKLYVFPQHRKKGYGTYVASALAQKLLSSGKVPHVCVLLGNEASHCLHEGLGFKRASSEPFVWVRCSPK